MKATELITAVQNAINKHGDFDINVVLSDSEMSVLYECYADDGWDIDFIFDERDNEMGGGWICADLAETADEDTEEEDY